MIMTKRELVINALEHKETQVIPWQIDLTHQAHEQLIKYTGDSEIEQKLGSCIHYIQYSGWPTEMADMPEHFRDEFGVIWNRSGVDKDIGVVVQPQITDLETDNYEMPQCDTVRLRRECEDLIATKGDRFAVAGVGFCMFERSWSLMGMEAVLTNMIACPDELEALYNKLGEYYLNLLDIILEYDIDGVYFGDDWGQQKGLIMGPEHWRHFIKPQMAKLYARVKAEGKYVIQHSCGDCHEIFPDLIEIGLDCYQTFQPEVYDIAEIKTLYGDKLTFWGGISTQQCLPYATPEEVKAECLRVMNILRKNGGLIIAPTHAVAFDVPPENILAMVDIFQNQ